MEQSALSIVIVVITAAVLLVAVWKDIGKFLKPIEKLDAPVRASVKPTGKTAFVTLDWVKGRILASVSFAEHASGTPTLMASIMDADSKKGPDYNTLAMEFISNCASCEEAMGLRDRHDTIAEIKSWNIVVSATGRAHNALSGPRHPTVEFSDAIKIAKASLYGWID